MDYNRKPEENQLLPKHTTAVSTKAQLPEWHPFAVWRTQIKTEQTGTHPVLQSVNS